MSKSAFPIHRPVVPEGTTYAASMVVDDGMTLRDYFAAKAMQGIFSRTGGYNPEWAENGIDIAEVCYEMADLMLRAREYSSRPFVKE